MTSDVFNMDCMEYMRTLPDKFFDLDLIAEAEGLEWGQIACRHILDKLKTERRWNTTRKIL